MHWARFELIDSEFLNQAHFKLTLQFRRHHSTFQGVYERNTLDITPQDCLSLILECWTGVNDMCLPGEIHQPACMPLFKNFNSLTGIVFCLFVCFVCKHRLDDSVA